MPGNHASRIAGAAPSTPSSVSGRPLNSTTTNGLPVALIASISSSCLPGRSISLREAASPLWPRDSPSASTTWSAALGGGHGLAEAGVRSRSRRRACCPAAPCRRSSSPRRRWCAGFCALDAVEDGHRVRRRARGPTTGRACRAGCRPSGPITAVVLLGSSGSRPPSFLSSTIERPAALRAAASRRRAAAARPRPWPGRRTGARTGRRGT